jgi:chromate transporter
MSPITATQKPLFREALRFWWKLGWISFGGTAAHIAIMHDYIVEKKKWIGNDTFLHALSHCMLLPGPEAQQLAIYIGWRLHGKKGGLVAGTLFVLPSMFVLLALSVIYARFGNQVWMVALFNGLKPAVIALVILALQRIASRALHGWAPWLVAGMAFAGMFFLHVSLPLILLGAMVLGVALGLLRPEWLHQGKDANAAESDDEHFLSPPGQEQASVAGPLLRLIAAVLLLWLMPITWLYFWGHDFRFWKTLALFFTKTAFVTIGGSYTVIPYVAQVAVAKLQWLSKMQMVDGFALAETTPGPLIIVVAFVGFMAAYNHFHGSLWMGTVGLLITTFYTFLPCFLFVFAAAPTVERTRNIPAVKAVLVLITSVVVGAILDLTLYLGKAVIFPSGVVSRRGLDGISLAWVVLSLWMLKRRKWNVLLVILLSLAFGALRYVFGLITP